MAQTFPKAYSFGLVLLSIFALTSALPPVTPQSDLPRPTAENSHATDFLPTSTSSDKTPLPLIIWHGLGDDYAADGLASVADFAREIHPGTFVYNIRLDEDPSADRQATFFGNLTMQIEQVCADVSSHPILGAAGEVDALGFSQGGQFLRGMVERCTAGKSFGEEEGGSSGPHRRRGTMPRVRSLVTFGAQHNGISAFRGCKSTDWLCRSAMGLLRLSTWSSFVQNRLVPAQYYRTVNDTTGEPTQEYLDNSNFLADINNERDIKNATYAENLSKVGKLVMYVFQNDTTVVPKESGWFAEVNGTSGEVTPLSERRIYKEDWLGLKLLDERGGLVFRNTSGEHMDLTDEVLEQVFVEFFGPPHEKEEAEDGERQVPSGHDPLEL